MLSSCQSQCTHCATRSTRQLCFCADDVCAPSTEMKLSACAKTDQGMRNNGHSTDHSMVYMHGSLYSLYAWITLWSICHCLLPARTEAFLTTRRQQCECCSSMVAPVWVTYRKDHLVGLIQSDIQLPPICSLNLRPHLLCTFAPHSRTKCDPPPPPPFLSVAKALLKPPCFFYWHSRMLCLLPHKLSIRPICGTMLTGGTEGSVMTSKPRLFPHRFSIWPPCNTLLTGGIEGSVTTSKACLFPHRFSIWTPSGTLLTGGIEGSVMTSKACLFPHRFSIWTPSGTLLTGGTEGSVMTSKACPFPHRFSIWPPCGTMLIGRIEGSVMTSKPRLFSHKFPIWPPRGTVLTGGIEGSTLSSNSLSPASFLTSFPSDHHVALRWH